MAWNDDLLRSMDVFDRLIKPILPKLIIGKYIRVEGTPEEIAELLDKQIGIDAFVENTDIYYGLGSRIQIDSGVWNTFTIRCSRESNHRTEYEKLKTAIKHGALCPTITMQAYIEDDRLQSIAVAKTKDIIDYIDKHECPVRRSKDGAGWSDFYVVGWGDMKKAGYKIRIIDYRSPLKYAS